MGTTAAAFCAVSVDELQTNGDATAAVAAAGDASTTTDTLGGATGAPVGVASGLTSAATGLGDVWCLLSAAATTTPAIPIAATETAAATAIHKGPRRTAAMEAMFLMPVRCAGVGVWLQDSRATRFGCRSPGAPGSSGRTPGSIPALPDPGPTARCLRSPAPVAPRPAPSRLS